MDKEQILEVWKNFQGMAPDIYDLTCPEMAPYRDLYIEAGKAWIDAGKKPSIDFNSDYTKFRIFKSSL